MKQPRSLLWGCLAILAGIWLMDEADSRDSQPSPPPITELPVEYRQVNRDFREQPPLMLGEAGVGGGSTERALGAPSLANVGAFTYRVKLGVSTPVESLDLSLTYRDGDGRVGGGDRPSIGQGWSLRLPLDLSSDLPEDPTSIDLLVPDFGLTGEGADRWIYVGSEVFAARLVTTADGERFLVRGARGVELELRSIGDPSRFMLIPASLRLSDGTRIQVDYRSRSGRVEWMALRGDGWTLQGIYDPVTSGALLEALELSVEGEAPRRWRLGHTGATFRGQPRTFLTTIALPGGDDTRGRALSFSHGILEENARDGDDRHTDPTLEFCRRAPARAMWRRLEPSRLPENLSFKRNRGLRFLPINRQEPPDLVNVREGSPEGWRFEPDGWRRYPGFGLPRALTTRSGRTPTGSQLTQLEMQFPAEPNKPPKTSSGFQSVVTSFYVPRAGELEYRSEVCFPHVSQSEGIVRHEGSFWHCDASPPLQVPMPLQYESSEPFPVGRPGVRSRERSDNQGAQFVPFPFRTGLGFFASWLRYVNTATGKGLLGEHRDLFPENCRPRFTTDWEAFGGQKRVRVELCQGFWATRRMRWREGLTSFWVRQDVDPDGSVTGQLLLPWHGPDNPDPAAQDRDFHFHYEGFRNVSFLQQGPDFQGRVRHLAIVNGKGCVSCDVASRRPPARHAYELVRKIEQGRRLLKWEKADPSFLKPVEAFEAKSIAFIDLDGDRLNDLVQTSRRPSEVYLQIENDDARWLRCPALDLPRACQPSDDCRLLDLDSDGDQDLFVGDGSILFENRLQGSSLAMTAFTDERGQLRRVDSQ